MDGSVDNPYIFNMQRVQGILYYVFPNIYKYNG